MMPVIYLDITNEVNSENGSIRDCGGWDTAILHIVTPTGQINFETSNDSGALTGISDGSSASSDNFIGLLGTNVSDGSSISSLSTSGVVKFTNIGRYLKVCGSGQTVTKAILKLRIAPQQSGIGDSPPAEESFLIAEDGDFLITENDNFLITET